MYKKEYFIGSNDVDQFLELKLPSFFRMMQDIATEQAEEFDIGKANTLDKGLFWVITRFDIDIVRMPKYLSKVTLGTYPGDDLRFIFPRYFELYDENGELIIKASSSWAVLDKNTHKVSLNPFPGRKFPVEHHEGELPLPPKCKEGNVSLKEKRMVRYSDVDLNGHFNNTKYIDFIIDLHDSEFYKKHVIKHFLINYDKEVKDNDILSLYSDDNNPEVIRFTLGDEPVLSVNITYGER